MRDELNMAEGEKSIGKDNNNNCSVISAIHVSKIECATVNITFNWLKSSS